MKALKKLIDNTNDFLQNGFKALRSDVDQELIELKKVENKLKKLQEREEVLESKSMFDIKNLFKFRIIGFIVLFISYIAYQSFGIIYLFMISYIISIVMESVIDLFYRLRFNRSISISIAYLLLVVFLLSGFIFIVPLLITQISEIIAIVISKIVYFQSMLKNNSLIDLINTATRLPEYIKSWFLQLLDDPTIINQIQMNLQKNMSQIANMLTGYVQGLGGLAINFVSNFLVFITQGAIVLTMSIMFSIEKTSMMEFVAGLGGHKRFEYIYIKLQKIYKKLGIWLKSRILLSVYIALSMYVILVILSRFGMDIPNKGTLSLILGLLDIIPYIGPILGSIPAIIAASLGFGTIGAIVMTTIVLIINFLENNVLIPIMMNRMLGINPIVIFLAVLLGGMLMGIVGILLSVPIAVIITLIFEKE